jgi:hypothetical protein
VIDYFTNYKQSTAQDCWSDQLFFATSNYQPLNFIGAIDYFYIFKLLLLNFIGAMDYFTNFKLSTSRLYWSDQLFLRITNYQPLNLSTLLE